MSDTLTKLEWTFLEDMLTHCTRHVTKLGQPFYTVQSFTDENVFYTVRFRGYTLIDNCKSGLISNPCKHKQLASLAENIYQRDRLTAELNTRIQQNVS